MANYCCVCNAEFRQRGKLSGYAKRPLSSRLRGQNVTVYEVLQMVCNYKVKVLHLVLLLLQL